MFWNPWRGEPIPEEPAETKQRISDLEARAAGLEKESAELRTQRNALEKAVSAKDKAITGLEYLIKKRRGIQTLELGSSVVTEDGTQARISAIFIDRSGVSYYIVWWKDGQRREQRVDGCEVNPIDDTLPLPKMVYDGDPT